MVISVEFAAEGLSLKERFASFSESLPSALALCFLDFRPQLLALQAARGGEGEARAGRRVLHFGGRGKAMLFEGTWREIRQMAKARSFFGSCSSQRIARWVRNDWPQNGGDNIICTFRCDVENWRIRPTYRPQLKNIQNNFLDFWKYKEISPTFHPPFHIDFGDRWWPRPALTWVARVARAAACLSLGASEGLRPDDRGVGVDPRGRGGRAAGLRLSCELHPRC